MLRPLHTRVAGSLQGPFRRYLSYPGLQVAAEVQQAVSEGRPVVALESTIITHGLPHPANIEMAESVEQIVRSQGAVPATVGFVNGIPKVGLTKEDLEQMADTTKPRVKISRRDVANVMAGKLTGGTTIAATMLLAHRAGIDVFATGGLGGVSRPFELMDVSADLDELSKTPVSVVCSGPKSILDVGRTIEYLETKGVPVFTYDDGQFGDSPIHIPGFYTRDSGVKTPFTFDDFSTAASVIYEGKYQLAMENGYVFCIPAPIDISLPDEFIADVIRRALIEASERGINGKELTPFLLAQINEMTKGVSVQCNVSFVKNNALIGSRIAKELARLRGRKSTVQPVKPSQPASQSASAEPIIPETIDLVIVGSVALDTLGAIGSKDTMQIGDSNPGTIAQSIGGVGFNVGLAAGASGAHPLLISSLNAEDSAGQSILNRMKANGLPTDGLCNATSRTAQYSAIHDPDGKLVVACADMDSVEQMNSESVQDRLSRYSPKSILVDSNVSVDVLNTTMKHARNTHTPLIYEPTSAIKAAKLASTNLHCYPFNDVYLMSPTVAELRTIFNSFHETGKFDDLDGWFTVLDELQLDKVRDKLDTVARRIPLVEKYAEDGVFQQVFRLLPYVPNIIVKDGANGLLVVQLNEHDQEQYEGQDSFTLLHRCSNGFNVIVQHYPALPVTDVCSVTGAGDSLIGYMVAKLAANPGIFDILGERRDALIMNAQKAACLSLASRDAVNTAAIRNI